MRKKLTAVVAVLLTCTACDMILGEAPPEETPPTAPPAGDAAAGQPGAPPGGTPAAPEKPTIGQVDAVEGEPMVTRGEEQVKAEKGAPLYAGDKLKTPAKAKARLVLSDKSVVALGPDSELKLTALDTSKGRKGEMQLAVGKFWMQVEKWAGEGESLWEVHTPNAVAGIRGTTVWGDTKVDAICSLDGTVEVKNLKNEKAKPVSLKAGTCASKLSKGKLAPLKPKPKQVQGYLKQVLIEDKQ